MFDPEKESGCRLDQRNRTGNKSGKRHFQELGCRTKFKISPKIFLLSLPIPDTCFYSNKRQTKDTQGTSGNGSNGVD